MSLEAKIELLTAAVEALTRAMQGPIVAREPSFTEQVSAVTAEYVRDKAAQQLIREREKEIIQEEISHSDVTEQYEAQQETAPSFTYDDVKRATNALSAAKGKEVTIAALARFGVTRATQLSEAQWGEYIEYCDKAAA